MKAWESFIVAWGCIGISAGGWCAVSSDSTAGGLLCVAGMVVLAVCLISFCDRIDRRENQRRRESSRG